MPRFVLPRSLRSSLLVGATGWLLAAGAFTGCAGSLDPSLNVSGTGSGGNNGSGGGSGTGTGGSTPITCTGTNDPTTILNSTCTLSPCHNPSTGPTLAAGLDLTPDANIASRLVGVMPSGSGGSMCGSSPNPYLVPNSNPAQGLLIDKLSSTTTTCGAPMPLVGSLTSMQVDCLKQWATTLTTGG